MCMWFNLMKCDIFFNTCRLLHDKKLLDFIYEQQLTEIQDFNSFKN